MNLIEELADVIAESGTHYDKAMNLLPIFAEWIKGIEKISPYEPFSENEDREYRVARTCWDYGFDIAIITILSELELEKMRE